MARRSFNRSLSIVAVYWISDGSVIAPKLDPGVMPTYPPGATIWTKHAVIEKLDDAKARRGHIKHLMCHLNH